MRAVRAVEVVSEINAVELSEKDGKFRSWIRVVRTGHWEKSAYGELNITRNDIAQMYHNFKHVTPVAPHRVVVDYNHGTMAPRNPDEGIAAGWVAELEVRNEGEELWADVEWTAKAAGHIRAKEYQGISPTIIFNYTYKDNRPIGTTLVAAAITNHPFIEDLEDLHRLALNDSDRQDVPAHRQHQTENPKMKIVSLKDKTGATVDVDVDSLTTDIIATLSEDVIAAHPGIKAKLAKLPGDDQKVVSASEFAALSTQLTTLSASVDGLKTSLSESEAKRIESDNALKAQTADTRVADLLRNGLIKSDDGSKAFARKMAMLSDAEFTEYKNTLVRVVPLSDVRGSGSDNGDGNGGDVVKTFLKKVGDHHEAATAKNPKARYSDSLRAVSLADKDLARQYHDAVNVPVQAGGIVLQ